MGVDYSFEVKNIEIWVPAFFKHNNSSVATVYFKNVYHNLQGIVYRQETILFLHFIEELKIHLSTMENVSKKVH